MKLCVIAYPNSYHTYRWLRYFVNRGHEVHLIADRHPQREFVNIPNLTVHNLAAITNIPKARYVIWSLAVCRLVRRLQPDILHAHQVALAGWLGWVANYHPFVVMPWGSDLYQYPQRSRIARFLATRVLRAADLVMADSQNLVNLAVKFGADPARSHVVQFGVDLQTFFPLDNATELRKRFGINCGPVIFSPRALMPFYRHDVLIKAIPIVRHRFPEAQFVFRTYIVDPPDYVDQLKTLAQNLGVADAVHFVGRISRYEDIVNLHRLADVTVSIPISDGTPMSVLEAFACAVPVITDKNLPSLREWITDGDNGLLVDGNSPEAVAQAIIRLLTDDRLYNQIRQRGLQVVRERADHTVWMRQIESMYLELIQR
ncbi:MAG: glycosyltransferase family 4 protein [Chloroflexi bacterium]|nr:MAG: glycosyltransferase family 4 protein [Chloroflexota bacterium]